MPRGSTAKGSMHEDNNKLDRHLRRGAFPQRFIGSLPDDFVPKNRKERRALASMQRKDKASETERP